jgi:hypothetical protein
MLSRNVKVMLLLVVMALVYTFVLGCDDTVGVSTGSGKVEFSGHVTTSQVKNAIRAIEDSGFGVSASAIGAELKAKYGECNVSVDLYRAVGDRCEKMGLGPNCVGK